MNKEINLKSLSNKHIFDNVKKNSSKNALSNSNFKENITYIMLNDENKSSRKKKKVEDWKPYCLNCLFLLILKSTIFKKSIFKTKTIIEIALYKHFKSYSCTRNVKSTTSVLMSKYKEQKQIEMDVIVKIKPILH